MKWGLPILLVLALAVPVGLVMAANTSGGSAVSLGTDEFTKDNPTYESVIVGPEDTSASPIVLYSVDVANQSAVVAKGSGDICTVTLTNNIPAAMANGSMLAGLPVTMNGDIMGNIVVEAYAYTMVLAATAVVTYTEGAALGVVTMNNVVCHPGKTVVEQVPIVPGTLKTGEFVVFKAHLAGVTW